MLTAVDWPPQHVAVNKSRKQTVEKCFGASYIEV